MASFNDPKLSNHIADDVPAIRQLLRSVAALDPVTGNTDIPNGAKRLVETAQGYEFQSFNGTAWVALEKWNLDVQKVDGFSASTGTTASTIPVRDASGKLPGDITGNAATASKAAALSATNPIATGGTGATTAEQARTNLGTPPKNHASSSTEFGAGSSTQYGHLKSHDAPDSTKTAATGHAFSPAGAAAMQETLEGQIEDLAGVVSGNAAAQATKDSQQDSAIQQAQSTANNAQNTANTAKSGADAANAAIGALPAVAKTGSYNDLSNKPTIPASPKAYISETWKDNNGNWYRKWSDGWVEQGGKVNCSSQNHNVSLHTPFTSTNYTILLTQNSDITDWYANFMVRTGNKTTTSFCVGGANSSIALWYACGY